MREADIPPEARELLEELRRLPEEAARLQQQFEQDLTRARKQLDAQLAETVRARELVEALVRERISGFELLAAAWADYENARSQTLAERVTAFDARYNASQPSDPVTVTTVPDTTPPSTPSGLTVGHVEAGKVLLSWNSGTDEFQPVRHEILVNGVPTPNAASTVTLGTIPRPAVQGAWVRQLEPSTSYEFTVRAIDPSGNVSGPSNTASATTGASADTIAPTTPFLNSAFEMTSGQCPDELWFDFSASTDGMSALDYELRINGVINEVIPEGGDRNTITYHEFDGPFTVTVVAVDLAGNASAPSNAITVSTLGGGCF